MHAVRGMARLTRTLPENRGPNHGSLSACELAVRDAPRDVACGGKQIASPPATRRPVAQATSARTAHCWESWKSRCAWQVGAIPRSATRAGRRIAGPRPPDHGRLPTCELAVRDAPRDVACGGAQVASQSATRAGGAGDVGAHGPLLGIVESSMRMAGRRDSPQCCTRRRPDRRTTPSLVACPTYQWIRNCGAFFRKSATHSSVTRV
jgi:hypothetical protein